MSQLDLLMEADRRGLLPPDKKALLEEATKRNLFSAPTAENKPPISAPSTAVKPEQPGFTGRVGQAFDERNKMEQRIAEQTVGGKKFGPEGLAEIGLSRTGGRVGDIIGAAVSPAMKSIAESEAFKKAQNMPVVGTMMKAVPEAVDLYKKVVPERAQDVLSAGTNAMALGGAAKAVAPVVGGATEAVTGAAKGAMFPDAKKILDPLHSRATATIESAKNAGIVFHPNEGKTIIDSIDRISGMDTPNGLQNRPGMVSIRDTLSKAFSNGDTSLKNLLEARDGLNALAKRGGKEGASAIEAISALDRAVENGEIVGGDAPKRGAVGDFRKQWGAYKSGVAATKAAELADESPAKSRIAFQKIVDSKYFNGLSPGAQKLAKIAAQGTKTGKFFETVGAIKILMGSRIPTIGKYLKHLPAAEMLAALAMGNVGTASLIGGSLAAGKTGAWIQKGLSSDFLKYLEKESLGAEK